MSSSNVTLVNKVLIGDGANSAAITDLSLIQKGDLFLVCNGVPITTVAAAQALSKTDDVYIAAGISSGNPLLSGRINGSSVLKYEGKATVAKANKQITLGYNGTASTGIAMTAGEEYKLTVRILDSQRPIGQRPTEWAVHHVFKTGETVSSALSTIAKVYDAKEYGVNFMSDKVKLERVSNGTRTAFAGNVTVINGATLVTVASAHGLSVGQAVKFKGSLYLIKEVPSTTTFRLDVAYKGVSETILATDGTTGSYASITEYGILLTALDKDALLSRAANEPYDQYDWIDYVAYFTSSDTAASDAYSATTTVTTAVNAGQGYWRQVAQAEEWAKGFNGDQSKLNIYDKRINSQVVVGTYYDSVKIQYNDINNGSLGTKIFSPCLVEIYIPDGGTQGDDTPGNNYFLAVLNAYFSDVCGFDAISF